MDRTRSARPFRTVGIMLCAAALTSCAQAPKSLAEPFSGTPHEYTLSVQACLLEAGWETELANAEDGTEVVLAPGVTTGELREQFLAASAVCTEALPPVPEPESEADLRQFYTSWTTIHRCLTDAGYELDPSPSFQRFVDEFWAGNATDAPYGLLPDPRDWSPAQLTCPKDPDAWW